MGFLGGNHSKCLTCDVDVAQMELQQSVYEVLLRRAFGVSEWCVGLYWQGD